MTKFSDLPAGERPKDRANIYGVKNLSNAELIAIAADIDDIETVYRLIESTETGVREIRSMSDADMAGAGLSDKQALNLKLAMEIGERLNVVLFEKEHIRSADDIYHAAREIENEMQEHFMVISLDGRGRIISKDIIAKGTSSSAIFDTKDILRPAITKGARAIALVHNHPTGDTAASYADIASTRKIVNAADILDLEVFDHVIVGPGAHSSLRMALGKDFFTRSKGSVEDEFKPVEAVNDIDRDPVPLISADRGGYERAPVQEISDGVER